MEIEAELGQRRAAQQEEEVIDVWPENVQIWDTFMALETNWRVIAGMSGKEYQGIERASIPMALEMAGVKKKARRRVLDGLRFMERKALAALNGIDQDER